MKIGDLARVKMHENHDELCLITGIIKDPGLVNLQVEIYFFKGTQRHWAVAQYHVELVNEAG